MTANSFLMTTRHAKVGALTGLGPSEHFASVFGPEVQQALASFPRHVVVFNFFESVALLTWERHETDAMVLDQALDLAALVCYRVDSLQSVSGPS